MYLYQKLIEKRSNFIETTVKVPLTTVLMRQLIGELKARLFEPLEVNEAGASTPQIDSCRSRTNRNVSYSIELTQKEHSLEWDCQVFDIRRQYDRTQSNANVFEFKAKAELVTPAALIETLEAISKSHK